jgi:hypothetical protein
VLPRECWSDALDLNELFSRHQIALIKMSHAVSLPSRVEAEECSDYYADCIASARRTLGAEESEYGHQALKKIVRG